MNNRQKFAGINRLMHGKQMAIQTQGVLGLFTGQLGKTIVGFKNKQAKVIRSYTIPANPRSVGQVAQRDKFRLCAKVAQKELVNIIRPFWNSKNSKYSGYAAFNKENVKLVADGDSFGDLLITSGSYPSIPLTASTTYDVTSGELQPVWTETTPVNGAATDIAVVLIIVVDKWDTATEKYVLKTYYSEADTRADGTQATLITIETGIALTDIFIFCGVRNVATATTMYTGDSTVLNPSAA